MSGRLAAARFAVGTFTRIPVPAPGRVDPAVVGLGLALGPAIGAGIGLASGAPLLLAGPDPIDRLLAATLAVALTAWLTRGLHWDGLADLADGLGSGAPADRALQVMRRSDIGPFGVLTLVLTLGGQVLALAALPPGPPALWGWVLALALGRLAVALACGPWLRPARDDGLGAVVVGSVTGLRMALAGLLGAAVAAVATAGGHLPAALGLGVVPAAAVGCAALVGATATRRLGGVTGDVLGAAAELSCAAALLALVVGTG